MIVLLNGSFGIGKTTLARILVERTPGSLLFDPELIGLLLQRPLQLVAPDSSGARDFQNMRLWRRLTMLGLRIASALRPTVFVPMTFSDPKILNEIRQGLEERGCEVQHFCLVTPLDTIETRLAQRGERRGTLRGDWAFRRASECCQQHQKPEFAIHVAASDAPFAIADDLLARLS